MQFSYFDAEAVDEAAIARGVKKLARYRKHVREVVDERNDNVPEYSLVHPSDPAMHDTIDTLRESFKGIKHLVLVGIGGSNLGTEAVHEALDDAGVTLHSLDTISSHAIARLLDELKSVRTTKKLAVCVISKSGGTAETMVNGGVLLDALQERYGDEVYARTLFIGDPDTDFMKAGSRLKVQRVNMPKIVGGRYSVSTEVGLVPLALLGYDTDAFIAGLLDATCEEFESAVAEQAARVYTYLKRGVRHYNFFAFEPRLATLGAWYRQLSAESLGKAEDRNGKPVKLGFLPTISTPVELHSVGQLYLSGFPNVYTDFVTFDDDSVDYRIPKQGIAKKYGKFTVSEVAAGLYGGVMAAYQEKALAYRSTIFDESLPYSLGLFMGMRMLETMYVAELLNVNAFDQPNVELYKDKTRAILGI